MGKIVITGTGRCGTTFLVKLFSFLGKDTGFTRETYEKHIAKNCNSGLEMRLDSGHDVIKNPEFMNQLTALAKSNPRCVIVPIREYSDAAASRARHGFGHGGLWHAQNQQQQVAYYNKIMAGYMLAMAKHDIPTIFLDFVRMTTDKQYLYNKLINVLDGVKFEVFAKVYDEVSATC